MEQQSVSGAEFKRCGKFIGLDQVPKERAYGMGPHPLCFSVCKFLYRNRPEASNGFSEVEAIQRYKTMRNRLQSKALAIHKTANDLEVEHLCSGSFCHLTKGKSQDEGKWLP